MTDEKLPEFVEPVIIADSVTLQSITANNITVDWPTTAGTATQALLNDGLGHLYWGSGGGGGGGTGNVSTVIPFTSTNYITVTDIVSASTNIKQSLVSIDTANNISNANILTSNYITANNDITVSSANDLRLSDATNTYAVSLSAPNTLSSSYKLVMPAGAPATLQSLRTSLASASQYEWFSPYSSQQPAISRCIYVANGGSDTTGTGSLDQPFASIARAITTANTLALASNPVVIQVQPGVYVENNTTGALTITSAGVTICGTQSTAVIIQPLVRSNVLFSFIVSVQLANLTISSGGVSTSAAIHITGTGNSSSFNTIQIVGFSTGIYCSTGTNQSLFRNLLIRSCETGIYINNCIVINISLIIQGSTTSTPANTGIYTTGSNSKLLVSGGAITNCNIALSFTSGSLGGISSLSSVANVNDLTVSSGSTVFVSAVQYTDGTTLNDVTISVSGASTVVELSSCNIDGYDYVHGAASGTGISCTLGATVLINSSIIQRYAIGVSAGINTDVSTTKMIVSDVFFTNNTVDIVQLGTSSLSVSSSTMSLSKLSIMSPDNVSLSFSDETTGTMSIGSTAATPIIISQPLQSLTNCPTFGFTPSIYGNSSFIEQSINGLTHSVISSALSSYAAVTQSRSTTASVRLASDTYTPIGTTNALRYWDISKNNSTHASLDFTFGNTDTNGLVAVTPFIFAEFDAVDLTMKLAPNAKIILADALTSCNLYVTDMLLRSSIGLSISGNITASGLTSGYALYAGANGLISSSSVTSTELGYLTGVTSSIQTQLNSKFSTSGGTLAGLLVLPMGSVSSIPLGFTGSTAGIYAVASGLSIGISGSNVASFTSSGLTLSLASGVVHSSSGLLTSSLIVGTDIASNANISNSSLSTLTASGLVANSATSATSANTPNTIVTRDSSGGFSAGTITLLNAATNSTDAVTKAYVDSAVGTGFTPHAPANALANSNISLSGLPIIDSYQLVVGSRVLLIGQSNQVQNGLYVAAAGAWSRPSDFAAGTTAGSAYVLITNGTSYSGSSYVCNTPSAIIDTNNISFVEFSLPVTVSGANIGSGTGLVYYGTSSGVLSFKTLATGTNCTITNGSTDITIGVNSTNLNTPSTIVSRDASGNFAAGIITASLTGVASGCLALTGGTLTGRILTLAGSAASPALSFSAASTSGLFYASGVCISVSSSVVSTFSSSGLHVNTVGTSTVPSLSIGNVGFSAYQTNTLSAIINNSDVASFAPSGLVVQEGSELNPSIAFYGNLDTGFSHVNGIAVSIDGILTAQFTTDGIRLPLIATGILYTDSSGNVLSTSIIDNANTSATSANTASAIVSRDTSGNFSAGVITASLTGVASGCLALTGGTLTGQLVVPVGTIGSNSIVFGSSLTGIYSVTSGLALVTNSTQKLYIDSTGYIRLASYGVGILHSNASGIVSSSLIIGADIASNANISNSSLATLTASGLVANSATSASSANISNSIVSRDTNGDFSASVITANLIGGVTGVASGCLQLTGGTLTGRLILPIGTYTTPSLTFTSSTGTGLSCNTSNVLVVSVNGAETASFNSSGFNAYTITGDAINTYNLVASYTVSTVTLNDSLFGTYNVIIGTHSLQLGATNTNCIAIGSNAGYNYLTNGLVAIGSNAIYTCTTGTKCTGVGDRAGYSLIDGNNCTFLGSDAGNGLTPLINGSGCTYIGANAYPSGSSVNNEIVIGNGIGNGSNTITLIGNIYTNGITLSSLTANQLVYSNGSKALTSVTIGSGITFSSGTLSASGTTYTAGTGIDISSNIISNTGVVSLAGTANRISVSASTGAITINLPQDIATTSNVTFANTTLSSLTANQLVYSNGSKALTSVTIGSGLTFSSGTLSSTGGGGSYTAGTGIDIGSNVISNTGVVSLAGTANRISVSAAIGAITLDLPQDIAATSSVTFASMKDSSISSTTVIIGTNTLALAAVNSSLSVGVGSNAMNEANSYTSCVAIGAGALQSTTGSNLVYNIGIGTQALNQVTGPQNTAIGHQSMYTLSSGQFNTAVGYQAGYSLVSGYNCVFIGGNAGNGGTPITSGNGGVYVGYDSYPSSSSVSNEIVIGTGIGNGPNTITLVGSAGCYLNGPLRGSFSISFPPGSSANPSINFTNSATSGFSAATANVVSADILGNSIARFSSTGLTINTSYLLTCAAGTSAAPSINFTGSTTTGLSCASNVLSLDVNGVSIGRFSSAGLTLNAMTTSGIVINSAAGLLSTVATLPNNLTTATSASTNNTIVLRDGSGNINANLISGTFRAVAGTSAAPSINFTGSTTTGLSCATTNVLSLDVNGVSIGRFSSAGLTLNAMTTSGIVINSAAGLLSTSATVPNNLTTATSSSTSNTIVLRDGSGNFSCGTISSAAINTSTLTLSAGTAASPTINFTGSTTTGFSCQVANNLSIVVNAGEIGKFISTGLSMNGGNAFIADSGTTSAPSIRFNGSLTTGLSCISNVLSVSASGGEICIFNSAGFAMNNGYQLFATDGTAAVPSISFASSRTTGFSAATVNVLSVDVNAIEVAKFNSLGLSMVSSLLTAAAGTASVPSITFTGSTTTGLSCATANVLSLDVNGVEKVYIDSNGLKLSNGTSTVPSISFASSVTTGFSSYSTDIISAIASGIESFQIRQTGIAMSSGKTIILATGLTATPSITFSGSLTTGFSCSSNTMIVSSNALEVARFSSIGITSRAGTTAAPSITFTGSTTTGFSCETANNLVVSVSGTEIVKFNSSGLTLTGFSNKILYANGASVVVPVTVGTGLLFNTANGTLSATALVYTGGTGINISTSVISNTGVVSLAGTANRISVSAVTGAITLDLPQDITTTSNVTFANLTMSAGTAALPSIVFTGSTTTGLSCQTANNLLFSVSGAEVGRFNSSGLTLSSLTTNQLVYSNGSKVLTSVTIGSGVSFSAGTLSASGTTYTAGTGIAIGSNVISNTGVLSLTGTSNRVSVSAATGAITINLPQDIATSSNVTFANLTLGAAPLANCILKTVAGVISAAVAYTDYTPALTANGNVTINTGTGVINTVTSPTFTRILSSSIGTNNTLSGTNAGAALLTTGSGGNTLYGFQAGVSITSGLVNTCVGMDSGIGLVTGSNGVYIGNGSSASSSSASNEGVINLSGGAAAGKGASTMFINSTNGLYSYMPAYWWGTATGQTGGVVAWTAKAQRRNMNLNPGDSTQLILPYIGLYEVTMAGCANIQSVNQSITMFVNGSIYLSQPVYIAAVVGVTNVSITALVEVTSVNAYVQYSISANLTLSAGFPLVLTAKFISL